MITSSDMLKLIVDVEKNQHAITKLYPSRILYFQTTCKYDDISYGVVYDQKFESMIKCFEKALGNKVYRPTAKKILNNWFAWAVEQRVALIKLATLNKVT